MEVLQQDWALKWNKYSPENIAVKEYETGKSLTYAQLNALANRLAHHLKNEWGIKKGSRVAVLAENCLEYIVFLCAAQKLGFILVPLNYRLTPHELAYLIQDADPSLVIVEAKFAGLIDTDKVGRPIFSLSSFTELLDASIRTPNDITFENVRLEENDPVFILYTSGTTGFPKGALYTHKMLFWNSINTAMSLIINTESRTINCMPPFHTGGWNVLTTPLLHHGGYTCLMRKFDATAVLELLETEKVTVFLGVPTMLKMMAAEPGFSDANLDSLYYAIVGGEAMPIHLIETWHNKGVPIRQGYGMTEVGPNLTSLHQRDAVSKIGSIGFPNYYVETRIVDESGNEVAPNESGELLLRGPMVTPGYWRNETATQKAIKDGWYHTGDLVRRDEDGYLYVVDRIKNMFISGGENVYPAEVERTLEDHPQILETAVLPVPDEKWGEVGRAFVVIENNIELNTTELKEFATARLAKYKVPKYWEILPELPKASTGKIDRQELKKIPFSTD